jgi:hypothetical protein
MLAMLFISIAFFAYISLHIRIIDSNAKLELREGNKEMVNTDIVSKMVAARAGLNTTVGVNSTTSSNSSNGGYPGNGSYPNSGGGYPNSGGNPGQSATMIYRDATLTQTPTGLPTGLQLIETKLTWTDKNGLQTYYVDSYERQALTQW